MNQPNRLPPEIFEHIFGYLSYPSLKLIASCCTLFQELVKKQFINRTKIYISGKDLRSVDCLLKSTRLYKHVSISEVGERTFERFRENQLRVLEKYRSTIVSLDMKNVRLTNENFLAILENLPNLKELICDCNDQLMKLFSHDISNWSISYGVQLNKLFIRIVNLSDANITNLNTFMSTQHNLQEIKVHLVGTGLNDEVEFDLMNIIKNESLEKIDMHLENVSCKETANVENLSVKNLILRNFDNKSHLLIKLLPNLEVLEISNTDAEFDDETGVQNNSYLLESIMGLKNLRKIDITFNDFFGLCCLQSSSLKEVSLKGEFFGATFLKFTPNVEILKIQNAEFEKDIIKSISTLKSLKRLEFISIEPMYSYSFKFMKCPSLEYLSIFGLAPIKYFAWNSFLKKTPNIKELNVYSSHSQTSFEIDSLNLILESLEHLEKLGYLSGEFADECVKLIFKNPRKLKEVLFYESRRILSQESKKLMEDNPQILFKGLHKKYSAQRYYNEHKYFH